MNASALPVYIVDGNGNIAGSSTISLAANITLAANASTAPVKVGVSKTYLFSYVLGGTSPSVKLQYLGADGATWIDMVTVTANGGTEVDIYAGGAGAALRLTNTTGNSITGLSAALVS